MTKYMIEVHKVLHEMEMTVADISMYGEIVFRDENPKYSHFLFVESYWDKEVLEGIYGVKMVREPRVNTSASTTESVIKDIMTERRM